MSEAVFPWAHMMKKTYQGHINLYPESPWHKDDHHWLRFVWNRNKKMKPNVWVPHLELCGNKWSPSVHLSLWLEQALTSCHPLPFTHTPICFNQLQSRYAWIAFYEQDWYLLGYSKYVIQIIPTICNRPSQRTELPLHQHWNQIHSALTNLHQCTLLECIAELTTIL